jgi:hypothetical protein
MAKLDEAGDGKTPLNMRAEGTPVARIYLRQGGRRNRVHEERRIGGRRYSVPLPPELVPPPQSIPLRVRSEIRRIPIHKLYSES